MRHMLGVQPLIKQLLTDFLSQDFYGDLCQDDAWVLKRRRQQRHRLGLHSDDPRVTGHEHVVLGSTSIYTRTEFQCVRGQTGIMQLELSGLRFQNLPSSTC